MATLFRDLISDLRVGLRSLLRAPLLSATIVLTVGLGIGATTVIFAGVNAAILRPLPYADPDQLVRIYLDAPPNRFRFSVADYLALAEQQTRFEAVAGYTDQEMAFTDGQVAERLRAKVVSPGYFPLLGVTPALGRTFAAADGKPGSPRTVIVSQGFWRQRLAARPDVVGRPIRLDGSDYTVVGVLPASVGPLDQRRDLFVAAQWSAPPRRGPFLITVLGRLRHGVDRSLAAAELREINRRIFPIWRASYQDERASWGMLDLKSQVLGEIGTTAGLAIAAVVLVWLIACANASNLIVARVAAKRRELAVRAALGASRARVIRHLLVESTLLACSAAAVGGMLAWSGVNVLASAGAGYIPRAQEIRLDGIVLAVLAAVTAASVLMFGLIPALHGTGGRVDPALRSLGRSSTGSVAVRRLRQLLVASQFAVATPLLIAAALLLISLNELRRVDLGFDSRNIATGAILLPAAQYPDAGRVTAFWDEIERRVRAIGGVSAVAFADSRPPAEADNRNNFDLEDAPAAPGQSQPVTPWVAVSPGYFDLIGIRLVEGRLLDNRDGSGAAPVIVVDTVWAARFFPRQSAIGKRLREGGCTTCPWTTVVGVVSNVKYVGLDTAEEGTVYYPIDARGGNPIEMLSSRFRYLFVRTSGDPAIVLPSIRQAVHELDASLPFSRVSTIDDLVAESLQMPRSLSLLVGCFAAVALLLSIVGIYGVMANYVQQHAKDIGVRIALGGSAARVVRLTVGRGMRVVAAGTAAGLVGAFALTRLMSNLLFGVEAADAVTFGAVAGVMLTVALLACLVPARRAVSLEPAIVLRSE